MKLRRRGTRSELQDDGVLLKHMTTAEERSSGNTLSRVECFKATGKKEEEGKGCHGKAPLLEGPLSTLGLLLSWQQGLTVASGLLVALLLALTQAYWVNSIHENLLWFSQLTVRAPWTLLNKGFLNIDISYLSMCCCTSKDLGARANITKSSWPTHAQNSSIYGN